MAAAMIELVQKSGAAIVGCGFLIEKVFDQGRAVLPNDVASGEPGGPLAQPASRKPIRLRKRKTR